MQIVIIGSGNVATIFAKQLHSNNNTIVQIIARNPISGKALAEKVNATFVSDYNHINKNADAYIISVQDDSLPIVAQQLENILPQNALVIHTTGSASINVLKKNSSQYGVLYPLQSLRKENTTITNIPLFLDGNTPDALEKIELLAKSISPKIAFANDEQRIKLHIAAVFVSNFPNYLYTLADAFCKEQHIDFSFLLPLMEESVHRLHQFSPKAIQTGPAARGDISTINKHKEILQKEKPELLEVYSFLTEKIVSQL